MYGPCMYGTWRLSSAPGWLPCILWAPPKALPSWAQGVHQYMAVTPWLVGHKKILALLAVVPLGCSF
jgi:hypothetical protein